MARGQWPKEWRGQEKRESCVLRTYIVGGVGVKKLHFDWQVEVVPASPGETWLPNHRYECGCVSQNSYLALESICSCCLCDRRQAISQSCFMGFFLCALWTPPLSPFQALEWIYSLKVFLFPTSALWTPPLSPFQALEWIYSLKVFLFLTSGDDAHRLSRGPPLLPYHSFTCSGRLAALSEQAPGSWVKVWVLLLASSMKFSVRL